MARNSGKLLHGQSYDPQDDTITQFTEQEHSKPVADTYLGGARTEIEPTDRGSSSVRIFSAPSLDSYARIYDSYAVLNDLPDVLESITITYNKTKGSGVFLSNGAGISVGDSPAASLSEAGRANSSLSIIPDLQIRIKQYGNIRVRVRNYRFYMSGDGTISNLLTKLTTLAGTTVNAWPNFRPVIETLTLEGQQVSVSVDVSVQQQVSINTSTVTNLYTIGEGDNYETGVSVRTVQISNVIHGAIAIANPVHADSVIAVASAGWPDGGVNWPARSASKTATSPVLQPRVLPNLLVATTPAAIPTSGLYLYSVRDETTKFGYTLYHAIVIDFADLV